MPRPSHSPSFSSSSSSLSTISTPSLSQSGPRRKSTQKLKRWFSTHLPSTSHPDPNHQHYDYTPHDPSTGYKPSNPTTETDLSHPSSFTNPPSPPAINIIDPKYSCNASYNQDYAHAYGYETDDNDSLPHRLFSRGHIRGPTYQDERDSHRRSRHYYDQQQQQEQRRQSRREEDLAFTDNYAAFCRAFTSSPPPPPPPPLQPPPGTGTVTGVVDLDQSQTQLPPQHMDSRPLPCVPPSNPWDTESDTQVVGAQDPDSEPMNHPSSASGSASKPASADHHHHHHHSTPSRALSQARSYGGQSQIRFLPVGAHGYHPASWALPRPPSPPPGILTPERYEEMQRRAFEEIQEDKEKGMGDRKDKKRGWLTWCVPIRMWAWPWGRAKRVAS
ncbi:hypothetical protein BJY04DRAFT_224679 [Aspergillus karnatakaensis]|uniref:uncharacterized protein n=1 Tax=Aspergillus karnatakaensis TaxID=1810916 RepID=UPI003CCCC646